MTNLEDILNLQAQNIELFAKKRVVQAFYKYPVIFGWVGDFDGIEELLTVAIQREIEWLKEEKK